MSYLHTSIRFDHLQTFLHQRVQDLCSKKYEQKSLKIVTKFMTTTTTFHTSPPNKPTPAAGVAPVFATK